MEITHTPVIVIDLGNTALKIARFEQGSLVQFERIPADQPNRLFELEITSGVDSAAIAATNHIPEAFRLLLEQRFKLHHLVSSMPLPIKVKYESPSTLGIDRLANAVMASARQGAKKNSLVVDMGTCITYDLVLDNSYMGGMISPGLTMRAKAMHHYTARLPEVEIDSNVPLLGSNTQSALQAGCIHGWREEIKGVVRQYTDKFTDLSIIYTGGDLMHFEGADKSAIFADPMWTLKGYHEIYRFNAR